MRALGSLVVLVAMAPGCGRWNFDAERSGADGGDATVPGDARADGCDPQAPFGTPVPIASLNDTSLADDGTLRLDHDELTGYFWSRRSGLARIYYASRSDREQPFTVASTTGINPNDTNNDLDPTMSSDRSLLVFRHNVPGDELWMATSITATTFTSSMPIASLNTGAVESQPYLQPAGTELVFHSTRSGGGDLFRSTRTGTTFSAPTRIDELASTDIDGDPVLSEDGRTIYFRSDRLSSIGGFNIFVATRPDTGTQFGAPVLVPNVNSASGDGPSFISPDGCRLYLSSDRTGNIDIFVATRGT